MANWAQHYRSLSTGRFNFLALQARHVRLMVFQAIEIRKEKL
jgi:hypothetical protein